jgi:cellulose synthase/poly-beta-1,6-N-acetylglucosamine synthase-like glycosyltransferase
MLAWAFSRLFGEQKAAPRGANEVPRVSIIIAAHNEEQVIGERLQNLIDLDYPADRLDIIIASDGSTDRTCDIVRTFRAPQVRLLEFTTNRGKAAVLNDAVAAAKGEILLLSDANTMIERSAVRAMTRWFADPSIGVVCGRLVLTDPITGNNADSLYWRYETLLKTCESRLGALLGANGAIYAIRRSLFPKLEGRVAVDDFVIPLLARLRGQESSGIVYEERAVAYEESPAEIRSEFARRSRIGAGGFQSLSLLWPLMDPRWGWTAFAFISHKLLRWLCPFFLIGVVLCSLALSQDPLYRGLFLGQVALYTCALAGYYSPRLNGLHKSVRLTVMFAAMNLALLNGFMLWASGRQTGAWQRTAR